MLDEIFRLVAQAHTSGQDNITYNDRSLFRVRTGMNNALYRVELGGETFACKLFVQDERRRARREYRALNLIASLGLDIAPLPLGSDESCTIISHPVVIYAWQEGTPLGPTPTDEQLIALLSSIQRQLACQPPQDDDLGLETAWFHWFDKGPYLEELQEFLDVYGSWLARQSQDGYGLYKRLHSLVEKCRCSWQAENADFSKANIPRCLCHVDPNLANAIWCPDGAVRWVDWEYSGWGDPALELADFRWHIASAEIGRIQHDWLRAQIAPPKGDQEFDQRLVLWDRLLVTRWPFLVLRRLWSKMNGPDRERLTQPAEDIAVLREQLVLLIERAERHEREIGYTR